MHVRLYRCFDSDHRISMGVVADSMERTLSQHGCDVSNVVPSSSLERRHQNRLIMRYLRYWHYPRYARALSSDTVDVHHVIDHGYAHLLPSLPAQAKRVVSVYDLIPFLTWKGVIESNADTAASLPRKPAVRKPLLNLHSLKHLSGFDHITTSSEQTSRDLQQYFAIKKDNISVIPPVLSDHFAPVDDATITEFCHRYDLDRNKKWLMISGREYYKNHLTSLRVFKQLLKTCELPLGLIKTGMASPEFDQLVTSLGLNKNVKTFFLADQSELPVVYSLVDCVLFPSLYEGFGMPVAEALACGTPAVISNRGSLPEVAPQLLDSYEPFDIEGLAQAAYQALNDNEWRDHIAEQGPKQMQMYHSDVLGQRYIEVYQSLSAV